MIPERLTRTFRCLFLITLLYTLHGFPLWFLSVAAGKSVCIIENSFYFNYIRANQPFYKTSPHTRHWHPSHIRDQNKVLFSILENMYHLQVKACCPISCSCSWMKLFKSNIEVYILGADLNKQKINCRTEGLCTWMNMYSTKGF